MRTTKTKWSRIVRLPGRDPLLALVCGVSVACTGNIGKGLSDDAGVNGVGAAGGATSEPGEKSVDAFACDESKAPDDAPLRRLTNTQYRNTLHDVVAEILDIAAADVVMKEIAAPLSNLPLDERAIIPQDLHGSYRRLDQTLQQVHVDNFYEVARALGTSLTTKKRLAASAGACASDAISDNDGACLEAFIRRVGAAVLRGPVYDEDVAFYRRFYGENPGEDPAGYADVVAGLFNSPRFLYLVEHGDPQAQPTASGAVPLTGRELASRLAYHVWQTEPDEELGRAADAGELTTEDGYTRQLDRLLADDQTRDTMREFFGDYLKVEDLIDPSDLNGDPVFKKFAGDDLPGPDLRRHMIEEALALTDYLTWERPGSLSELFTTNRSFARTDDVAKLYGVAPWDGVGEPPSLPAGQRPGVLTRAALVATGSLTTRPIMKGVFIRKTILCDDIPPPPANAGGFVPTPEGLQTTRQKIEALTEGEGSSCAGCHKTFINGLGFPTESFDALGRVRTEERIFSDDGMETGRVAIDTRAAPRVDGSDAVVDDADGLVRVIADSEKTRACFARNYFRFTFGRWENTSSDACTLASIEDEVKDGSLAETLRAAALTPAFRSRSFRGGE